MSKISSKQRVEQVKEWVSWFTATSKRKDQNIKKRVEK
jgi:hypothetical protein